MEKFLKDKQSEQKDEGVLYDLNKVEERFRERGISQEALKIVRQAHHDPQGKTFQEVIAELGRAGFGKEMGEIKKILKECQI